MKKTLILCISLFFIGKGIGLNAQLTYRSIENFNKDWLFSLKDSAIVRMPSSSNPSWLKINLPHDWSIEGKFDKNNPAGTDGAALPGGLGWYCKSFTVPESSKGKEVYIAFDGVYRCSKVWVNGHLLGYRPNGYISFRYDMTPYLHYGSVTNVIAVRVDNSLQKNSRWYSGSGIYRNTWMVTTDKVAVDNWGTYITSPAVSINAAILNVSTRLFNATGTKQSVTLKTTVYDANRRKVAENVKDNIAINSATATTTQDINMPDPVLWSNENPYLYRVVTQVIRGNKVIDDYETMTGIRSFIFDVDKGFLLNGKVVKIKGVCDHHDLGCLGTAINTRALERQLEILKGMGCNAIRTSHNPPAPELLDLCDKMGFIVMDEAFDMWKQPKTKYDYHLFWDEWHKKDLQDQILRDRNHASVFIWSIGNEIPEQTNPSGARIALELSAIVKGLDNTRPITTANNNPDSNNKIISSGAIDLVGYNYHQNDYAAFHSRYPGKIFIATETTSALETRSAYDMPSDSIRRWPMEKKEGQNPNAKMNSDLTCSAYDNVSTPWGSTHEETWKVIKKYDYLSGMFIWTGFDYLGEPTPYPWPARSSYFGIIDLAGFPKDIYYMYQSEWTDKTVLHILPHWNWKKGQLVDVWAYYNHADEVELFLNGKSLGIRKKIGDDLHVSWSVPFEPGVIKAVSRLNGQVVLEKEIKTAGKPAKIELIADRNTIKPNGEDLSFVTVRITDAEGNLVPDADNLVNFTVDGAASIAGVDNGSETSMESFKANHRKAFNGLALVVLQAKENSGPVKLTAVSEGLQNATISIDIK
jgi:beta-galactosidase